LTRRGKGEGKKKRRATWGRGATRHTHTHIHGSRGERRRDLGGYRVLLAKRGGRVRGWRGRRRPGELVDAESNEGIANGGRATTAGPTTTTRAKRRRARGRRGEGGGARGEGGDDLDDDRARTESLPAAEDAAPPRSRTDLAPSHDPVLGRLRRATGAAPQPRTKKGGDDC